MSAPLAKPLSRRFSPLLAATALALAPAAFCQGPSQEWTLGFETTEGYAASPFEGSERVTLLGGLANILNGPEAFEGSQWLRFEPTAPENGLFVTMPKRFEGAQEWSVRFRARLPNAAPDTRLVLARGETLAIRPVVDGIELEVAGEVPHLFPIADVAPTDWIDIELRKTAAQEGWNLYAWDQLLRAGVPLQPRAESLENLLIFADGVIDVDAITVTAASRQAVAERIQVEPPARRSPSAADAPLVQPRRRDALFLRTNLAEATRQARIGRLAQAENAVSQGSSFEIGSAMWHFEQAQSLAMVAFSLRQKGYNRQSVAQAREVLRHLELASRRFAPDERPQEQAEAAFLKARVWEYLLANKQEARKAYERTLLKRPDHASAKWAKERIDAPPGASLELPRAPKRTVESKRGGAQ